MSAAPPAGSTDPATIAFYQTRAPHYIFHSGEHHSHQLDPFLDRLPAGAMVLELGCGGGRDAARIRERSFVVDATDGTPAMVGSQDIYSGKGSDGTMRDWIDLIVRKP